MAAESPAGAAPGRWWSQYLAPTVVGGAIAFLVSTAFNVAEEMERRTESARTQAEAFQKVLTDTILTNTRPFGKGGTKYDEQEATAALMALDGLAETEQERRTVLNIGARLLTASTDRADTGGPGARFLDVSIGRILAGIDGKDADVNRRLLALVRSPGFVDMATAGYATQYYNDSTTIREIQPTLDGDQPITQEAKLSVLVDIGPPLPQAWIHLASWRTSLHVRDWNASNVTALTTGFERAATHPLNAVAAPFATGSARAPVALADWLAFKDQTLVLIKARLARADAPLVSYSGNARAGTLGRVIGAIRPLACVDLLEAPRPVLVFLPAVRLSNDAAAAGYEGVIHLWGHVRARPACPAA